LDKERGMNPDWRRNLTLLSAVLGVLLLVWLAGLVGPAVPIREVPWSELSALAEAGQIVEAQLDERRVQASVRSDGAAEWITAVRIPGIDAGPLVMALERGGARVRGAEVAARWWEPVVFGWLLPFGLVFGAAWFFLRRLGPGRSGPLSVGRSQAKIYDQSRAERVTFADVAGVDEAEGELVEVVEFLKDPERARALGARPPKGVLLVGPPGTGKTLLARAVAGEAGVPFFSMSGSEFVQMFVGVGAARVRDLFEQAKERAPCIVFIDELDAVGRTRAGAAGLMVHEEREQTLNQLLVEMDGFGDDTGVVILAASNRPEILDRALLRAGRFDRQVVVERPDVRGREAILSVHARKVKLAETVQLRGIAQRTSGMAGADLANVVNEAALAATRRRAREVELQDFEEAVDRIQLGLRKQGRVMTEAERLRVAIHESGHALVALGLPHADPVHRVTILPRSIGSLGATLQLPTEDRYLLTRSELLDAIAVMLGGRAAEELACGDVSTGAQNDLERATETARAMVTRFGMGEALGLSSVGALARDPALPEFAPRAYAEETARAVDAEIRGLLDAQCARARALLAGRRPLLDRLVARLLVDETLDRPALEALVAEHATASAPAG
jgi:cell division protease FtsH